MPEPSAPSVNSWLEDELYQQYLHDRQTVDPSWKKVFEPNGGTHSTTAAPASTEAAAPSRAMVHAEAVSTLPVAVGDQLVPLRGPALRIAENMTVVTAADIELMNAHTLADVLNTIPGVEVFLTGGPGTIASATILGSNERHVTVILDGVVLNSLWSGVQDVGMIPVQNIEKIEIIKGPASSAWGSALGGIVNIITKSDRSRDQGGIVYGSIGPNGFGDFRVEGRGKEESLNYYITAGRLQSNGLTPHFTVSENNAYAKVGESGKSGAPLTKPPILTARRTRSRSPPHATFRWARMLSAHHRAAFCWLIRDCAFLVKLVESSSSHRKAAKARNLMTSPSGINPPTPTVSG